MPTPPISRERACVIGLALFAVLRVLAYATAFPFFSNVDEHRHVDIVLKYARGYLPTAENRAYEPEMGRYIGVYGSPEYHGREDEAGNYTPPPPPWKRPAEGMLRALDTGQRFVAKRRNLETTQPPVYYLAAAGWLAAGRLAGLEGGMLLYWVRALAAPLLGALVLVSYHFLREIYPGDALMRLGVPLLLAVFPMDAFYYVTRDAISPLLAGTAFFLSLRIAKRPSPGRASYILLGCVLAAAFLAKYTNLAVVVVCGLCTLVACVDRPGEVRRLAGEGGRLLGMWAIAAVAAGTWLVRNLLVFGDLTGTAFKVERMGWQPKPLADWFDHPLFSAAGATSFVGDLVPLFWRGELVWHRTPLASGFADGVYLASTIVFLAFAVIGLRQRGRAESARLCEAMALVAVLVSVAILVCLSLAYVFHETSNPSAARPYFVQGRLISGVLVPCVVLYVRGIQISTSRLGERLSAATAWSILATVAAVALASELWLHLPVFASQYNLFHLP